jgi:Phage integrase, N-terminal SAM-like domain
MRNCVSQYATTSRILMSHIMEPVSTFPVNPKRKLLDQVRDVIRLKHFSYRTEEVYVGWIRRFILFHNKRHPKEMGEQEGKRVREKGSVRAYVQKFFLELCGIGCKRRGGSGLHVPVSPASFQGFSRRLQRACNGAATAWPLAVVPPYSMRTLLAMPPSLPLNRHTVNSFLHTCTD